MSDRPMVGRVAWVTGSSRGIGRVIATQLAEEGANVAVHGTSPTSVRAFGEGESLEGVRQAIAEQTGGELIAVWGDLTQPEEVARIVGEIRHAFGCIDILVNCAGGDIGAGGTGAPMGGKPEYNDPVHTSVKDIQAVIERNLMTCILCCRQVAPEMMERKSGRIVNVGSIAGLAGRGDGAFYGTAKAAVHQYTRSLADYLRSYDVAVNAVAPGNTVTPRWKASRETEEGMFVKKGTLVRYGWPEEIARAVVFLCSEDTTYITGQVLRVDGGHQCWPA